MKIARRVAEVSPSLTLELTARAKKMKTEGLDVISFGAGEPDFNTPEYIRNAAKKAIDDGLTKYTPASGTATLKKAICDKLLRDNGLLYAPEAIVVSNGAKHSLANAISAVVEDGDEVIIPAPFWLTYPELVRLSGGKPVIVPTCAENGFKLTADELKAAITDKTAAIILNNPNNPTGAVYSKKEIESLAQVLDKTEICVISDEIYEKLNYTGEPCYSIANYSEGLKARTIIVNGVSKTYAMTGWRIGFTASDVKVAKAMGSMQSHMSSNPNTIAQYAAEAAYTDPAGEAFLKEMLASFSARRELIAKQLKKIDRLDCVSPDGAFYAVASVERVLGKSYNGKVIDSAHTLALTLLEEKNVAVIPCESFGAPGYIRLSYAISEEDIVKGTDRLAEFIAELK